MLKIDPRLFALFCVTLLGVAQADKLPSSVKVCNHKSSNYSACLKDAIQQSLSTFANGIPELDVPQIDPLIFNPVQYEYQIGLLRSHLNLLDAKTYGISKMLIRAVRPTRSANRMSLQIDYKLPKTFTDGHYNYHSNVGPFKVIGGKGYFNQTAVNTRGTIELKGRIENDRWVIEHVYFHPLTVRIDKVKFYFDDLFNGNKIINKAALFFINEFWPALYLTMLPITYKRWDSMMTDILNRMIFSKLPFSETFP